MSGVRLIQEIGTSFFMTSLFYAASRIPQASTISMKMSSSDLVISHCG
jgi:hypothetical protein